MKATELKVASDLPLSDQINRLEADVSQFDLTKGSINDALAAVGRGKEVVSREIVQIDPRELEVMADMNPRVQTEGYKAHVRALADSMKVHGFYQDKPLAGYAAKRGSEHVIYIYEGGSRLAASLIAIEEGATFTHVPVSLDTENKSVEDILVAMVRGNTGRPLTPYENGLVCKRLSKMGWDSKKIAMQLGFSVQRTDNLLLLMGSDHRIRQMVATEQVAADVAINAILKHHERAYEVLAAAHQAAKDAGKNRVTERFVHSGMLARAAKKSAVDLYEGLKTIIADPSFAALSDSNQELLMDLLKPLQEIEETAAEAAYAKSHPKPKKAKKQNAEVVALKAA
jgi:ParB family chromosome partitioning protein